MAVNNGVDYDELAREHGMANAIELFARYTKIGKHTATVLFDAHVPLINDPNDMGVFAPKDIVEIGITNMQHEFIIDFAWKCPEFRAAVRTLKACVIEKDDLLEAIRDLYRAWPKDQP